MPNLQSNQLKTLIISAILMVIGILFCCSLSIGISGLSTILGILLIIAGLVFVANAFLKTKTIFCYMGIMGAAVLALGILFITNRMAGILFGYIPWLLIVLGALIILDAIIAKFYRNDDTLMNLIIKIVLGLIAIILGICLRVVEGFMEYASIILGILMVIYAIYLVLDAFVLKKDINSSSKPSQPVINE